MTTLCRDEIECLIIFKNKSPDFTQLSRSPMTLLFLFRRILIRTVVYTGTLLLSRVPVEKKTLMQTLASQPVSLFDQVFFSTSI